jgi:hypothetical protein
MSYAAVVAVETDGQGDRVKISLVYKCKIQDRIIISYGATKPVLGILDEHLISIQ